MPEYDKLEKIAARLAEEQVDLTEVSDECLDDIMKNIVNDWKPRFSMITLFIRCASRSKRDFNRDSIAVLCTVAEQCNITTLNLLKEVKCYHYNRGTYARQDSSNQSPYGFRLCFARKSDPDSFSKCASSKVNNSVLGVKFTIASLEHLMNTNKSVLGKVGMKSATVTTTVSKNGQLVNIKKKRVNSRSTNKKMAPLLNRNHL